MRDELFELVRELRGYQDELEQLWYRRDEVSVAQRRRVERQRVAAARHLVELSRDVRRPLRLAP
jgi:hypothetical protein